jgi:hypothetical protein
MALYDAKWIAATIHRCSLHAIVLRIKYYDEVVYNCALWRDFLGSRLGSTE